MWEERFNTPDYVFGTAPARFMTDHDSLFAPGQRALCVADGEGRNSVWLAEQGLEVTALDYAPSAVAKARALAAARGVTLTHVQADVFDWDWPEAAFDHVVGVFIQFMGAAARKVLFDRMKAAVRPGGLITLHGYTPKQLEHGTGGPRALENLYTPEILADHFAGWEIVENREHAREIVEGTGHAGMSALIDLVARRP